MAVVAGRALNRQFLERLYALSVEAERALHDALDAPGSLLQHYDAARREELQAIVRELLGDAAGLAPRSMSDLKETRPPLSAAQRVFPLNWGGRTDWRFTSAQIQFIADTILGLLRFCSEAPAHSRDLLVQLRMRFYGCHWMIRQRCGRRVANSESSRILAPRAATAGVARV